MTRCIMNITEALLYMMALAITNTPAWISRFIDFLMTTMMTTKPVTLTLAFARYCYCGLGFETLCTYCKSQ